VDQAPEEFWRYAFPLPFRDKLETRALENAVDPYLMAALIRQESEFDPRVVSRANAIGLTQIKPSTGKEISRQLGIKAFKTAMLYDADTNLQMGVHYLGRMLNSLEGKPELALAAYNAGRSRAVNWRQWGDFREPAEFIETIPFNETRAYVQIVLRNADLYRRLYPPAQRAVISSGGLTEASR
jgi:soluble lytic murein transglycosylase